MVYCLLFIYLFCIYPVIFLRRQVKSSGYPECPELQVISTEPSVSTVQSVHPDIAEHLRRNVFFRNIRSVADGLPQFG